MGQRFRSRKLRRQRTSRRPSPLPAFAADLQQLGNTTRRLREVPAQILRLLTIVTLIATALATHSHSEAQATTSRLGAPPRLQAVPETAPELTDEAWSRRTWLLEASAGPALGLCPRGQADCTAELGSSFSALVQTRPLPLFSWGPFFNRVAHAERYVATDWTLRQATSAWALGLAGRLWMQDHDRIDPYVQVSAGLGSARRSGELSAHDDRGAATAAGDRAETVPLYSVTAGVAVQLSSEIRIGTEVGWSHWLFSEWEQCPVLSGVCVNPPLRSYDPHNGVLSLSLSVGLSFGSRL